MPVPSPHRVRRRLCFGRQSLSLLMALALAWPVVGPAAQAQTFKDPTLEALLVTDKSDALRRTALQRLAAQPDDAQAVLALALAALESDDADARAQALQQAQACARRQPQAAPCHYAHGVLLGVQAMADGLMTAARSAGAVQEALTTAHRLEPHWYPARSALMEFYLVAPGFMGGSVSKATELARGAPQSDQTVAMQARIATQEKRFDVAVAGFLNLSPKLDPALAADVLGWGTQAGLGLVNAGQAAKAQPLFERLLRDHPGQAGPAYGLARALGETAEPAALTEALRLYELASTLKGAVQWPAQYRIGLMQQQLGRVEAAKAAYKRFLANAKGPKKALDDARNRLDGLGN